MQLRPTVWVALASVFTDVRRCRTWIDGDASNAWTSVRSCSSRFPVLWWLQCDAHVVLGVAQTTLVMLLVDGWLRMGQCLRSLWAKWEKRRDHCVDAVDSCWRCIGRGSSVLSQNWVHGRVHFVFKSDDGASAGVWRAVTGWALSSVVRKLKPNAGVVRFKFSVFWNGGQV